MLTGALATVVVTLGALAAPQKAFGEDMVCAQIMPCTAEGGVFPPYNTGGCSSYYEDICERNQLELMTARMIDLEKKFNICVNTLAGLATNPSKPKIIANPNKKKPTKKKKEDVGIDF